MLLKRMNCICFFYNFTLESDKLQRQKPHFLKILNKSIYYISRMTVKVMTVITSNF